MNKNSVITERSGTGQDARFSLSFSLKFPVQASNVITLPFTYTWKMEEQASLIFINEHENIELIILCLHPLSVSAKGNALFCKFIGEWEFFGVRRTLKEFSPSPNRISQPFPTTSHDLDSPYVHGIKLSFESIDNLQSFCDLFVNS